MRKITEEFQFPSDWSAFVEYKKEEIRRQMKHNLKEASESVKDILLRAVQELERERISVNEIAALCITLLDFIDVASTPELHDIIVAGITVNEDSKMRDISPEQFIKHIREYYAEE